MTKDIPKIYPTPNHFQYDCFDLASRVLKSDYNPTMIIGIWRGGTPPAVSVHQFLEYHSPKRIDHAPIMTSFYDGIDKQNKEVKIELLGYVESIVNKDSRLLIVDDVWETGKSVEAVINTLKKDMGKNVPKDMRVATVYYKPLRNLTSLKPDFYIHETDYWIVFPVELEDLTRKEIANKGNIIELFDFNLVEKYKKNN